MISSRYFFAEHKGTIAALVTAVAFFIVYVSNHPAGLTAGVATTAANKGVLLALVAMAQTLPVLTAGLDLSVGMVFVLANCLASTLVVGSPLETAAGVAAVLATGLVWAGVFAAHGPTPEALRGAVFLTILFGISISDARFYIIPDQFSVGGSVLGVGMAFLPGGLDWQDALIGGAVGFATLWLVGVAGTWMIEKLSPGELKEIDKAVDQELLEMDLRALREAVGLTQEELARKVVVTQSQLSKLERREDHRISTLRRYVEALGGRLEVSAVVGGKRILIIEKG